MWLQLRLVYLSEPPCFESLTADSEIKDLKSPNYGVENYPNNYFCEWQINAPGDIVTLAFKDFSVSKHIQYYMPT